MAKTDHGGVMKVPLILLTTAALLSGCAASPADTAPTASLIDFARIASEIEVSHEILDEEVTNAEAVAAIAAND